MRNLQQLFWRASEISADFQCERHQPGIVTIPVQSVRDCIGVISDVLIVAPPVAATSRVYSAHIVGLDASGEIAYELIDTQFTRALQDARSITGAGIPFLVRVYVVPIRVEQNLVCELAGAGRRAVRRPIPIRTP
jgi:hypothetical protein